MSTPRKAAGTRSMSDVLRHPSQLLRHRFRHQPFGNPDADYQDLRSGTSLLVGAQLCHANRVSSGELIVRLANRPIAWRARTGWKWRGPEIALAPPLTWVGSCPRSGAERWKIKSVSSMIEIADAEQVWRFAVPTDDVALIRLAVDLSTDS